MADQPIILYEDNQIIVALKPQNIPTQADESKDLDFLTILKNYIKEKYNKQGNVFLGLVQRLDRPTGGVMVFARTSKSAERLCKAIIEGDLEKKYLAVTVGAPTQKQGKLVHYLQKDTRQNIVRVVPFSTTDAKRAELDYKVLEENEQISLLNIRLITGRSHQARVQLSTIGCPIFGDAKYGGDKLAKGHNLALWAYELRFFHPVTKQAMMFKAFPPVENTPWKHFAIEKHIPVFKSEN